MRPRQPLRERRHHLLSSSRLHNQQLRLPMAQLLQPLGPQLRSTQPYPTRAATDSASSMMSPALLKQQLLRQQLHRRQLLSSGWPLRHLPETGHLSLDQLEPRDRSKRSRLELLPLQQPRMNLAWPTQDLPREDSWPATCWAVSQQGSLRGWACHLSAYQQAMVPLRRASVLGHLVCPPQAKADTLGREMPLRVTLGSRELAAMRPKGLPRRMASPVG